MRARRRIRRDFRSPSPRFTAHIVKEHHLHLCSRASFGRFAGTDPILRKDKSTLPKLSFPVAEDYPGRKSQEFIAAHAPPAHPPPTGGLVQRPSKARQGLP